MKRVNYYAVLVLCFFNVIYADFYYGYDPLLVVVIMVKNEETVMRATLQPFVDGGIDTFFVLDTGSTDKTIAVTQDFFNEHGIVRGYIEQEPFIDFATSRNRALALAHEKFPQAAFMVMLDAEWYLNDAKALVDFCQLCLDRGDLSSTYLIRMLNTHLDFYTCRLLRCHRGARFEGVVHEALIPSTLNKAPENIYFEYLPEDNGVEKTAARFVRDRELLLKEHQKKPWCTRTLFYLARTCEDLGDWPTAYDFYKKRVAMVGWDEEDFIVHYRLAETIKKLVLNAKDERYDWSEALTYYLKAYQMRPHRAEPLIAIADYYAFVGQMRNAFLFARQAAEIAYPEKDMLFVQRYLYDYYRYEVLAHCAWHCSEFQLGEWAAQMAYNEYPDYNLARANLRCYLEREVAA